MSTGASIGKLAIGAAVSDIKAGLELKGRNDGPFSVGIGAPVVEEAIGTTTSIGWNDGI